MLKISIYFILAFFITACSTTVPVVTKYKISSNIEVSQNEDSICKDKSIKVSSAFTNASLMSKDMSYVRGHSKVFKYSESAWLNNPNRAVSTELIKMLRESKLFRSVQESQSRSVTELIVESSLEEFMQYYSENLNSSYALVQIHFSIIEAKTNKVLYTETFRSKVDTKTLDAQGGVDALNEALQNTLKDSSQWFIEVCR